MEGLTDVTQRVNEISSRLASLAPPAPAGFTAALQTATAARTTAAPAAPAQAEAAPALPSLEWAKGVALAARAGSAATASTTKTATSTATTATSTAATSGTGRLSGGVPADLRAYGNGKIPASALERIGHGEHRLWAPAATAFRRLEAAAERAGVDLGVTDSYRSYAEQVDLARRKGLYSQGGLAARPGTSDHGWGRSLDLRLDNEALSWMREHAEAYGFAANVPRESWHWTYSPPS